MQALKEWNALKEWAVVVKALAEGRQCVLFRKGGILDPGFSVESPEFLLFPTYEHQTKEYLKEMYRAEFDELISSRQANRVTINSAAKIVAAEEIREKERLYKLRNYHVYTDDFIDYRMQWNPENPMSLLFLRTFVLENPLSVDILPQYAGCRSWIKLNAPAELGTSVLSDKEFIEMKKEIEAIIV